MLCRERVSNDCGVPRIRSGAAPRRWYLVPHTYCSRGLRKGMATHSVWKKKEYWNFLTMTAELSEFLSPYEIQPPIGPMCRFTS
jgi:hypothetical protein